MNVLVLGATGSIGAAVARELKNSGHHVVTLARSDKARLALQEQRYQVISGDLRAPDAWMGALGAIDAIVHAAATFTDDMGAVDRQLLEALVEIFEDRSSQLRFVYTGGCWLYGESGDHVATESTPFNPIPAFSWMVENANYLRTCNAFSLAVIHPAMVYGPTGGVFTRFIEQARRGIPLELWGGPDVRWPLVHRNDLARAYALLVEQPVLQGHFNAASENGVPVGEIALAIARAFGRTGELVIRSAADAVREHGAWALGPTLDQQMSAAKLRSAGWTPEITDYSELGWLVAN